MSRAVAAAPSRSLPFLVALTVLCGSFALSGLLSGPGWLPYVVVTVLVVACVGVALRAARLPWWLAAAGQLLAVCLLAVVLFSDHGVLGVFPGPAALGDLRTLLRSALDTIRSGVAPVPVSTSLNCLMVLALGALTVIVDVCVSVAQAPAVAGLPLLCLYAVPASLDDDMLPWWSFVLGAAGFTLLLGVDRARKKRRWRGTAPRKGIPAPRRLALAAGASTVTGLAIAGVGVLLALFTGSQAAFVGTAGRLPGGGPADGKYATGQLGINPFTRLRGMLDENQTSVTMFKVRGLGESAPYLRALTLGKYVPDQGWVLRQPLPAGVRTTGRLPPEPGTRPRVPTTKISITPVHWDDLWLPVYGTPRALSGTTRRWHYDSGNGIVYTTSPTRPPHYTERAVLAQPTRRELRATSTDYGAISPHYLDVPTVDPAVRRLARSITAHATTPVDKAVAITKYFTDGENGFSYSLRTAPTEPRRGLYDFLFKGKKGFCEQYASAMAVLLREVGIPSRVAIGFTGGTMDGKVRVITSLDAHAWVEVYFPGYGWLPFDPTPLDDGRKTVPSYLSTAGGSSSSGGALQPGADYSGTMPQAAPQHNDPGAVGAPAAPQAAPPPPPRSATGWVGVLLWSLIGFTVLLALLAILARLRPHGLPGRATVWAGTAALASCVTLVVATAWVAWWLPLAIAGAAVLTVPLLIRVSRRRRHLRLASGSGPRAAPAAWDEVLAEHADRGGRVSDHDTARVTAAKIVRRHHLDSEGQQRLRALVEALERAWYGDGGGDHDLVGLVREVRSSFRRNAPLSRRARLFPRSVLRG